MKKYRNLFFIVFVLFIMLPIKVSAMEIFVKTLTGKNISLEVESSDTIDAVKEKIYEADNTYLPTNQKLFFGAVEMENGRTLADYNVRRESTINLIFTINNEIKVTFDANGGTFENGIVYTIDEWDSALYDSIIYPTRDGYKFIGYFTEKTDGIKFEMILNESGIDSDMTFYAQWEEKVELPLEEEDSSITTQVEQEIENPQTSDSIENSIFVGTISLIGLVAIIFSMRKNKKKVQDN